MFTAEFAESAEKSIIFTCTFVISPLRALRPRAKRAVNSCQRIWHFSGPKINSSFKKKINNVNNIA